MDLFGFCTWYLYNLTKSYLYSSLIKDPEPLWLKDGTLNDLKRRGVKAMGKKPPKNTTQEVRVNPILGLVTTIDEEGSGILAQEAQGQHSFVGSDTLPTDLGCDDKTILEAAGVKFLGPVEDDKLFQYVKLPQGWKKNATDHSMWSNLVDNKGRVRAKIFYKAAFYDRKANMHLVSRFGVSKDYARQRNEGVAVAFVSDCDTLVFSTDPVKLPAETDDKYDEISNGALMKAIEWLNQHYPDWENSGAYWD